MLTQANRHELKRHIADILNDTGLPTYLKVNRLADLLEDRLLSSRLEIPTFDDQLSHFLPTARPSAKKSRTRQQPAKRKNATSARTSASARKGRQPDVGA